MGGVALGLSGSPRRYFYTFNKIKIEWKSINNRRFKSVTNKLSKEKFLSVRKNSDGSITLALTKKGIKEALLMKLLGKAINFKKPKRWDKKWRIVVFDIPESDRIFRSILRKHLYNLDFYKLQNSVFISPYPCEQLIKELISLYSAKPYVHIITAIDIDNEKKLKKYFLLR